MKALRQFYNVDRLVTDKFDVRFTGDAACQMLVQGADSCQLVLTDSTNAIAGPLRWHDVTSPNWQSAAVHRIEYTIIGSPDGERVGAQRYFHDFTTYVTLLSKTGEIRANKGALFIPYQMDVLLDTTKFGKVTGIQFIA